MDQIEKAVLVIIQHMVVVPIRLHRLMDLNLWDVHATHYNSVVVPMVLQLHKDHIITVVIVRKPSSNVVPMKRLQLRDQMVRVVLAWRADMVVVRMVLPQRRVINSKVAHPLKNHHKKHADYRKQPALAEISVLNTSSTHRMAHAHVSGMVVVKAMITDSKPSLTARLPVKSTSAKKLASCQRVLDHALATIRNGTLIQTAIVVKNSTMVVVMVLQIASIAWPNAKHSAPLMRRRVSWRVQCLSRQTM